MGLFDFFKKEKITTTFPENELEKCLINRDNDTDSLKFFYQKLIWSKLIILHHKNNELNAEEEMTKINVVTFDDDVIPVFTSFNRIFDNNNTVDKVAYLSLDAQDLFKYTEGNTLVINPYSPNNKVLVPDEIKAISNGTIYDIIDANAIEDDNIKRFNQLYEQAVKDQEGLTIIGDYKTEGLNDENKKRLNQSINGFKECLKLYPDHWQSMFLMAKAFQALSSHIEAMELLEKVCLLELEDHNPPREASIEAIHLNNLDKAIFYSEEALRRTPDDYTLMGNHAANLILAHKDDEALLLINEAIKIDPNDSVNQNIKSMIEQIIAGEKERPTLDNIIK